ncbi:outer membrane beta-barrel family protein [Flavobacterium aurantiibacter]|uniref:Outer membrane protein beta-barrel domain-containing protein n=1 Tax=Flavobacterium aurantiibacter TaxID=2023067 RepID=A0A255ZSC4_9FLAO|nr:outer membrane beta-barrel family protein [Flavobacterium aurantiibacter]OYQ44336.1 hypothetical protein CHX27_07640 [Flavobacterium aurantiibacter]
MSVFRCTLVFFLLLTSIVYGQNSGFTLSGKINSAAEANLPITITLSTAANKVVATTSVNEQFQFVFTNVAAGAYNLQIEATAAETLIRKGIALTADIDLGALELKPKSTQLTEVVISQKKPIVKVQADKTVFQVENTINATGTSGFELLRKTPGVVIDNNDNLIVEGKSGVLIYIDGKQSFLSGSDLTDFLKTIQATDISAIELITEPSSKYDAAGTAGIINIKLKKSKLFGTNGSVSTGLNVGEYATTVNAVTINNRSKYGNFYANYSNRFGRNYSFINLYRTQNGLFLNSRGTTESGVNANNFRIGYDYSANSKHTFGAIVSGNFNNNYTYGNTRTPIGLLNPMRTDSILRANNIAKATNKNLYANVNYKYQDSLGHQLNIDVDYGLYSSDRDSYQPNIYYNPTETEMLSSQITRQITPTDIDIYTSKIDYEQPLLKGKFSAGGKFSVVKTTNVFDLFDFEDGIPVFDANRSNAFDYTENVNALYVNFSRDIGKFNFQLGLRAENTQSKGELTANQVSENQVVKRSYTDLFPSGGLTYAANQNHSWALIYSRRIERPNYQTLNPFQFQLDELNFQQGNPFLRPQYTHNLKFSHTYKYTLNTSLTYTYVTDFFAQVTEIVDETKGSLTTKNVANQEVINLGISYPFNVKDWWNVYASVNAFQSKYTANSPEFVPLTQETLSFYGQNTFSLPKEFTIEVSGWYSSPAVWGGTYRTASIGSLDVAFQKLLLQKKLNIRLAFSDILFTSPWHGNTEFGGLAIRGDGGYDSRQVRLNVSYKFGSDSVKKMRERSTGLEDEQNRLGS